mmetsp:Transcript_63629/g.197463  ORF Transcript_63629/g.197463 Transcript_63629/m.197463 type:complete len:649 (-) Transcript_63629:101-2047(-)
MAAAKGLGPYASEDLHSAISSLRSEYRQIREAQTTLMWSVERWMDRQMQALEQMEQLEETEQRGLDPDSGSRLMWEVAAEVADEVLSLTQANGEQAFTYAPTNGEQAAALSDSGAKEGNGSAALGPCAEDAAALRRVCSKHSAVSREKSVGVGFRQASAFQKRCSNPASASTYSEPTQLTEAEKEQEARRIVDAAQNLARPAERRLRNRLQSSVLSNDGQEPLPAPASGPQPWTQRSLRRVVEHPLFHTTCTIMILFNSVIIGLGVEHTTTHSTESDFQKMSGYACSIFFLIELVLRLSLHGRKYFTNENRNWNLFDMFLVLFSIVDVIMDHVGGGGSSSLASGMKTIKMLRIMKVFRVFRFFRELSLLALMIVDSMRSLMWALLMLAIIIYVFAICFTTSASEHLRSHEGSNSAGLSEVHRQFGSLGRTVYSLVQAMLGGVSWGVCCDALLTIDWFSGALFFFYVAFTILAVMNIITGVFVDNAVETARTQRDFLIQKEMELKEKYAQEMRDLFMEMDKDGSGTIGLEEINEYLEDPRVQGYFAALGLDPNDTERLFKLIDDDGSGDVDVGEFLDGCLRLKGQARSIDIYSLMHDMKLLDGKVDEMVAWIKEDPHLSDYARQSVRSSGNGRTPHVVTVTTTATATLV